MNFKTFLYAFAALCLAAMVTAQAADPIESIQSKASSAVMKPTASPTPSPTPGQNNDPNTSGAASVLSPVGLFLATSFVSAFI
ncbi:hypothetical protein BDB01DRAFT_854617 [Pilobolus umbonatus]|nr:hypothetical protein BDB01DRAFT_854617 [Pilobolus umbonatus]